MINPRERLRDRLVRGGIAAIRPALYLSAFILLVFVWRLLGFPAPDEVYLVTVKLFREYGLVIVALAGFVEGLVLVNLYFPGSAVIIIGVVASRDAPIQIVWIVAVATMAFMIAAQLNYGLGYFGFHRLISIMGGDRWLKAAEARYSQYGILILVPSFIHPNLGGFMSVAAGTAHLSYGKFVAICLPSVVGWNVFWGVVTYFAGGVAESVVVSPYAIIMAFSIWIVISFMWECVKQV